MHCKFRYSHKMLSVVVCRSVARVYCDKMVEARIMQSSLKCSPMPKLFACQPRLVTKFEGFPLIRVVQTGVGGFWIRDAISRKRCKIELRWQLITNRNRRVNTPVDSKKLQNFVFRFYVGLGLVDNIQRVGLNWNMSNFEDDFCRFTSHFPFTCVTLTRTVFMIYQ